MHSSLIGENANAVSRRSLGLVVVFAIVAILVASVFGILLTPALAGRPSIGLPEATPEYMKFIVVNNFRFDPLAATPSIPTSLHYDSVPRNTPFYSLVQFNGPVTPLMKAQLTATGATILFYIPYNAFIVQADGLMMDRASALASVRWTGVFEPAYKLSPRLSDEYGAMAQRATDGARNGDASAGAVSGTSSGMPSASSSASSGGPTAGDFSRRVDSRSIAVLSGTSAAAPGASPSSQTISLTITAFEPSRVPEILSLVSILGGRQLSYSFAESGAVRVDLAKALLPFVARVPGIMYVDRFVQPYVSNDIARWVVQSGDTVNFATPIHDHGIYGTGQTVTLGDTGIDFRHPAFWDPGNLTPGPDARKVTAYYEGCSTACDLTDNGINHGTHTSGSVAGDDGEWHIYNGDATGSNLTTGPHDGQAFDAFVNMQDLSNDGFFVNFDNITQLWQMAVDHDSWIHSNSWGGVDFSGSYILEAALTDNFIWNNQDFLVVFAAANAGSGLRSINLFGTAKNILTVGATLNGQGLEDVIDFSGRGPTADGRIKPDIMAPGVNLWSAEGLDPGGDGTAYFQLSGTSMATPTISAGSALIRQYYMDGWYPTGTQQSVNAFTPSAALIKATAINGAREMTGSGAYANGENFYPNDNQGFGRMTLDDGVFFQGDTRGLVIDDHRVGINTGDSVVYPLAVGDPSQAVEITLVWTDYPGTEGCTVCLVNDLDLTVTGPDGTIYRGNQYMGSNPGESTPNPTDRDLRNNVESVLRVTTVQPGLWTVEVSGFDVPVGPQSYAIVMTGGIASERGIIALDHDSYRSTATVNIRVVDTGLNVNPGAPDTAPVNMSSTTEGTPEIVTLTETGDGTSVFVGSIPLQDGAPIPGDGTLQVTNLDTITAEYFDQDDGLGGSGPTFDTAVVDDDAPVISVVSAINVRASRATIVWTTDEPSDSAVYYGVATPPTSFLSDGRLTMSHSIPLSNLLENTTYYFSVQSMDEAGNLRVDDNASTYYTFQTLPRSPGGQPNIEWPTFHNNLGRFGYSPSNFAPPVSRQWSSGPGLLGLWAGPVLSDGILFGTTLDGSIKAYDPFTGTVLWTRQLGDAFYYTGVPAVQDGVVFTTFYGDSGGFAYALDTTTGNTIWVDGPGTGLDFNARVAVTVADGLVIGATWGGVNYPRGQVYALNATTGSVVWVYEANDLPWGGAAVSDGIVYIGMGPGGSVVALDELDGSVVWTKSLGEQIGSAPVVAQGTAYIGTLSGSMFALDAVNGDTLWRTGGLGPLWITTPAFDGAALYFGTDASQHYALDASDGRILWQTGARGAVESSMAYANGFLYATSRSGYFTTIDAYDGAVIASDALLSADSTSSPAASDGWVWVQDGDGNIYGYSGTILSGSPLELLVNPISQAEDTVPDSTVDFNLNLRRIGFSGPDTFEVTASPGAHGWAVALYESDGTTPLPDTDADGTPDTGPMSVGATRSIIARVRVPLSVNPGDSDVASVAFVSAADPSRSKSAIVTTTVPAPGASVRPDSYFAALPGDAVASLMEVQNRGGFSDTIEMSAVSEHGWSVSFFQADGSTPLADTDGDLVPDTGLLGGLSSVSITVKVQIPGDAALDTLDQTEVTGTSAIDPSASGTGLILVELAPPPSAEWPQFHHDREHAGVNPEPFEMPLTQQWTALRGGGALQWTGPVIDSHTVYVTSMDGDLAALDIGTGTVKWQTFLGRSFSISGTPAVGAGSVFVTFVTSGGSGVTLFALDPATGAVKWSDESISFFGAAFATPAIGQGKVYWLDGVSVIANDAATGARLWSYNTGSRLIQGPTYWAGHVFFGTVDAGLVALDGLTGLPVWSTTLADTITSAPSLVGGVLYVGDYSSTVSAIDALTGSVIWSASGLGFNFIDVSTPVAAEGLVFVATYDFPGRMYALDASSGAIVWSYSLSGPVGASAAYVNGTVFITSWDGNLYAWDASTGSLMQQFQIAPFGSTSSVALGDGYLIVGDQEGDVHAFSFVGAGVGIQVAISPDSTDVPVASAAVFQAQVYDKYGNIVPGETLTWDSTLDLGTILPVSSSGDTAIYIGGTVAGTDGLVARLASGFLGSAVVNVVPGALDHVGVTPAFLEIAAGTSTTFGASGQDRFGNPIPGGAFTWTVEGPIGAINTATGAFTASTTVGTGTVTAHSGSGPDERQGRAIVNVLPGPAVRVAVSPASTEIVVGSTTVLSAAVLDAHGNEITSGEKPTWSAPDGGTLLRLSADQRLYQYTAPTSPGDYTVTVTRGTGITAGSVAIGVVAGGAVGILIHADTSTVTAGGTLALEATVVDAYNNELTGSNVLWSTTKGTISAAGVLSAPQQAGSVIVTASVGTRSAIMVIEVTPGPLSRLVTSTSSIRVAPGAGITVTVSAEDTYGNDVAVSSFSWETTIGSLDVGSNGQIASFFAGETAGTGTITVSAGGQTKTITVTVTEPSVSLVRQATSPTSLIFLVVAIIAIAASFALFVRNRETRRELEELRRGGGGGPGGTG